MISWLDFGTIKPSYERPCDGAAVAGHIKGLIESYKSVFASEGLNVACQGFSKPSRCGSIATLTRNLG